MERVVSCARLCLRHALRWTGVRPLATGASNSDRADGSEGWHWASDVGEPSSSPASRRACRREGEVQWENGGRRGRGGEGGMLAPHIPYS